MRDDELLVERAAVDADAHRLLVVARDLADRGELLVAPAAGADVAGIDPVFVERFRARRIAREQQVAVVVKVADERCGHPGVEHALLDFGNRRGRFRHVHRHPDHLRSRFGELDALLRRRLRLRRIGHGHRLDDDRRASADLDGSNLDTDRPVKLHQCHGLGSILTPGARRFGARRSALGNLLRGRSLEAQGPSNTDELGRCHSCTAKRGW